MVTSKQGMLWLASLYAIAACGSDPPPTQIESLISARGAGRPDTPTGGAAAVTLITGDRVLYSVGPSGPSAHVEPGPGRAHVGFATVRHRDRLFVIPQDVAHLVDAQQLDRALFDVTTLVDSGYGDRERDDLPLIITGASELLAASAAPHDGLVVDRRIPALQAVAVRQRKASAGAALAGLQVGGPTRIWLDRVRKLAARPGAPSLGLPVAGPAASRAADGPTGAGVTVAILDTGIDATHPDLVGKVIAAEDFTGDGLGTGDVFGEGTHVASVLAGSGAASDGQFRGVAPEAQLLSARVCEVFQPAGFVFCQESAVLAGLAWAAAEQHARIVAIHPLFNDLSDIDAFEAAIADLSARFGTLFVAGAGDFGEPVLAEPANTDEALAVSAVDAAGQLAAFSSRGPRSDDGAIKPDVTALGVDVVGARASGVEPIGTPVGTAYQALSGTELAAARAAGAAALVFEQHPDWTAAQVKAALTGTADPNPALSVFEQGSGQLDIARATHQSVVASLSNLSLGRVRWPHDDDPIIERTVSYRNAGTATVHLALSATLRDPARQPAPAGMVRVTPAAIDVPAGASVDVVVAIDSSGDAPDGQYEGALVASGDDVQITTPIAIEREVESYYLKIRVRDLDAQPALASGILIGRRGQTLQFLDLSDELTLRAVRDEYTVMAMVGNTLMMVYPRLELDRDSTADLDGGLARPIALKVPGVDPELRSEELMYIDIELLVAVKFAALDQLFSAGFGPESSSVQSLAVVSTLVPLQQDEPDTVYLLAHRERGHFLTGWSEVIEPHKLARVDVHDVGHGVSAWRKWASAMLDDAPELGPLVGDFGFAEYAGPFDRTEYYYGPELRFQAQVFELAATFIDLPLTVAGQIRARRYPPGSHIQETWHQAPSGPAFGALNGTPAAQRVGDVLRVAPSLTSDPTAPAPASFTLLRHDRSALYRDGVLLVEHVDRAENFFPPVEVPPGAANYRLELSMSRGEVTRFTGEPLFELSTEVSAAWTFHSAHVDGQALLALPTLRFTPALDDDNRTAARLFVLPFHVDRPVGAPTPAIADVDLEVSFDDGVHWTAVPVLRLGDRGFAIVLHPRHAQFASLRGSARDVAGNRVDQTIIRAYGLAP